MSGPKPKARSSNDYTVAIISAMSFEMSAVRYMLDAEHPSLPSEQGDPSSYVFGELNGHNVVLACLPGQQGKGATAIVATNLSRTFKSINWRLFVGIGAGVWSAKHDVRLGDVVVSMPEGTHGGVVQYDLGRDTGDGFHIKGFLHPPPSALRSVVEVMRSDHLLSDSKVDSFVSALLQRGPRLSIYRRPATASDILYEDDNIHIAGNPSCDECDQSRVINRQSRTSESPEIHYGLIASGDSVIKRATIRQSYVRKLGDVLCFEMEAAGLMTEFEGLVIRGISDYGDSHKNDEWHHYAAATAAAFAKELLYSIGPTVPVNDRPQEASGIGPDSGSQAPAMSNSFIGHGIQQTGGGSISASNLNIS